MVEQVRFLHGGLFESEGDWIHPERVIDNTEIILVRKGVTPIEENGVLFEPKAGSVLRLDPGLRHRGTRMSTAPVSFYWFHFDGALAADFFPKSFALAEPYRADLLSRQLLHYETTPDYPPEAAENLFRVLLLELRAQAGTPSVGSRLLGEVTAWIYAHRDRAVSSADAAAHFGYNEDYLSRLFRARYGYGLKQYIVRVRMQHIKTLLLSPDYTLQQIAEMTGFADYKYFLRFFTRHEGETPTAFRAAYFNTHTNVR